ncbi:hypothetical protein ISS07_04210 [Candidatus Woesearchaeota archaeon]|nr:hypothetical protein [Candidatus Woesearchaeota archaeon]
MGEKLTKKQGKSSFSYNLTLKIASLAIFLILAASVLAGQPTIISLQGKLTNATTGATIVNADLKVNISDVSGTTIWNETFSNGVSNGFVDILLGSNADNELNLTFNEDYNISTYVGSSSTQIGGTYRFRSGVGGINPSNITSGNFSSVGNFTLGSLFVDKTNVRIGIGTTTPTNLLEVIGQTILASLSGNVGIGTTTPQKALMINGTQPGALTIDPNAEDPTINTTGENLTLTSFSGSVVIQLG